MSVFPVKYKVKNPETGKKITKTKWRVQIRTKDLQVNSLFDYEDDARKFEKEQLDNASGLTAIKNIVSENNAIDMRKLLKINFDETLSKQAKSSLKTNHNRSFSAIPNFNIPYNLIHKRINNYKFKRSFMQAMINETFDYQKDGIPFGDFFIETVDFHLLIAYIQARKDKGIANNTILREISTISGCFEKLYKYFPNEFPNGISNPVKLLPKGEKPKPYLERKRTLSDEEAVKIAEWLSLKDNQEPYYIFVQCLYTGARKSEVLGIEWQNINFTNKTIFLPITKNGRSRTISIEDTFYDYLIKNKRDIGKVFKLTNWNFRQYWVDALKALGWYDVGDRLHFHDTRRTSITKNIRSLNTSSFQLAKVFGTTPQAIEQEKLKVENDIESIIIKLRNGGKLTENEIVILAGHSGVNMTNKYFGDRD